jgi:hypothetical protein
MGHVCMTDSLHVCDVDWPNWVELDDGMSGAKTFYVPAEVHFSCRLYPGMVLQNGKPILPQARDARKKLISGLVHRFVDGKLNSSTRSKYVDLVTEQWGINDATPTLQDLPKKYSALHSTVMNVLKATLP